MTKTKVTFLQVKDSDGDIFTHPAISTIRSRDENKHLTYTEIDGKIMHEYLYEKDTFFLIEDTEHNIHHIRPLQIIKIHHQSTF